LKNVVKPVVKFCPRCGGPMMPVRKDGEVFFKCSKCGYEVKATKKDLEKYGMKYQVESSKRVATARATESKASGLTPEEREMLQEYYEIFLEEFAAEEGESGESD
jgi:DNA-directed RNA polymerase subunit M